VADPLPRLYTDLAGWFHLLTRPDEYVDEAAAYRDALLSGSATRPRTLLELGSGGGNNAFHLKRDFACTLSDLSPAMLALSTSINPECEHVAGDMRTLRLGRTFDAVFVHDAVMYLLREEDLRQAVATAFLHCRPGGTTVFAPDYFKETFQESSEHGGHDGADGRALRYLEWTWAGHVDPAPARGRVRGRLRHASRGRGLRRRDLRGPPARFLGHFPPLRSDFPTPAGRPGAPTCR